MRFRLAWPLPPFPPGESSPGFRAWPRAGLAWPLAETGDFLFALRLDVFAGIGVFVELQSPMLFFARNDTQRNSVSL